MPPAGVLPGSSRTRRIAATALAVCGLMLLGAAPGWANGRIAWHGCGPEQPANLQCGELSVPLDYDHPHGAKITLGFNRLPAADRAHRVGSLIINPGGPGRRRQLLHRGGGGRRASLEPALHERFDMIGMDPRGVGTSTPIQCDPDVYNQLVSLFPSTEAQFDQLASWARAFGQSCLRADRSAARPRGHAQRRARHGGAAPGARRREAELPRALLRRAPRLRVRRAVPQAHPHDGARCHRQPLRSRSTRCSPTRRRRMRTR